MFFAYFTEFSYKDYPRDATVQVGTNTLTFSNAHLDREKASAYFQRYLEEAGYTAGPEHRGYLLKCHVAETDEKALEGAREFLFINEFRDHGRPEWAHPSGYGSRMAASQFARHFGVKYFGSEMRQTSFDDLLSTYRIVAGSPKTVVKKLRYLFEELRPSILVLWANEGRISPERSKACLRLMGQEVLPAVREIGKELELRSPDEINAPVSLAHARGEYAA
ncbi:MAG: hypothetical protein FJ039_07705 [Chloroflexi bacterium]|nr:hypothetical protein [Chloroflexota bacterium]